MLMASWMDGWCNKSQQAVNWSRHVHLSIHLMLSSLLGEMSNRSSRCSFRASNRLQNRPSMDTCCCIIIISDHKHSENFSQWLKAPTTSSSIQKIETESSEVERKWKVNKVKDDDDGWWCKKWNCCSSGSPRGEVVILNHEPVEFWDFLTLLRND